MRKSDVEFHSDGYGYRQSRPAVNVKIPYRSLESLLPLELGSVSSDGGKTWEVVRSDAAYTAEWIEANVSDDAMAEWEQFAAESAWESLQGEAIDIWGEGVKVYSEGRSGGWAVVDGIPDYDTWDAIELSRWARFAKYARALADDVPRATLDIIYANLFDAVRHTNGSALAPMLESYGAGI